MCIVEILGGKKDKFRPIILLPETDIVILMDVSFGCFWYKCTHAHAFF